MAARRRAGQSPYLAVPTAPQSTSSVSLQEYAQSQLGDTSSTSLPQASSAASSSTSLATTTGANGQPAATTTVRVKKKRKKGKPMVHPVDPSIRSAVANVGLPASTSAAASASGSHARRPGGRSERSRPPQQQQQQQQAQQSSPRRPVQPARTQSDPQTQTTANTSQEPREMSLFRQRHGVWDGIDAEEEPPPAFAPRHSPPPPPAEPVSVAAAVNVPSSPPPSYSAELLPGPSTISTLNAPVADETPAQTLTADEWPPLFLLPSWLDVERLPVWQEAEQDQDLLRAWRKDEISGLPLEERARRHHMLRKRRDRLERRRQASISETLSQLQQRTPPPTATTQAESSAAATTAPDPESSLTAFMKATNDYIAQNFPQHDPSARQQEDSDNDEPRRSSSGSDAESDQTEPAGLKRRHPNRILPLVTPRMPAITTWDDKGEQTNANSNVLPKPGSVTMWGQDSNTRADSGTRSPAPRSPASNASSDVNEDRRELGRRHSALLVRPLSIKRKPPPIPAPRRWAQAVERASSDSPTETEDAASSTAGESGKSSERPRSGKFSTRMQALRERFENKPQSAPPIPSRRSRLGQRNSTEVPPSRPTSTIQEDAEDPQPSTVHEAPLPALPAENSLGISSSLKRAPSREEEEAARSMSSVAAAPEREDEQPSFRDSFQRISLSDAPWPLEHRESQASQVEHVQPAPAPRADSPEMSLRPQSSPPRPSSAPVETTPQSTTDSVPEAQARPAVPAGPALEPSRSYSSQGERSPPAPPARQPSVQYTELDALASRISDQRVQTGEAYDDIVLLSEILGPHQPQRPGVTNATLDTATDASGGGPVQQQNAQKREEEEIWDSIPVLPVEEQRRRTDPKTGKTRIKLSCGGVSVNKCQVCLSQFKSGEMCGIFPGCTHCFHEGCLRSWLRRSARPFCPTCRRDLP